MKLNLPLSFLGVLGLLLLGTTFQMAQTQWPWPVTPFNQSQEITGNFCEYRDTSPGGHFHNGTDIPKPDGSAVYPVKDGVLTAKSSVGSNAYVRVNDIAYVHIFPNPALSIGDSVFASQTILGTILSGLGHVHLTNGYPGAEKNSMLPNSGLTPLNDPWPPVIRYVQFYLNNTNSMFPGNELSSKVDIVVKVDEANAPPTSPLSRRNNGTYKIGYKILSADSSTVVYQPPNGGVRFQFNVKPNDNYVNTVYFQDQSTTSSHVYQVTNNISSDNYWDTATLPYGDYVVMIFTEDTRSNTDTAWVPVTTIEADNVAPVAPELVYFKETDTGGMQLSWLANNETDLAGYRLYFSFDNALWSLLRDEEALSASAQTFTLSQLLNQDVYFRLSAVDNAPLPNESEFSDVYGMSNGSSFLKKVLIVDGFDRTGGGWSAPGHYFAFTHGRAILPHQVSFDTYANETVSDSLVNLGDYDAVFWILGDESVSSETFSAAEQAQVQAYLENGGYLFLSGSEIAYDLDPDGSGSASPEDEQFLHDYLKADFAADNSQLYSVSGGNSGIFYDMNFDFGTLPYPVASPDVLIPLAGAQACLSYNGSQTAAIQYEGTFGSGTIPGKLLYLAFPFETIEGELTRHRVMARVFNFFFGLTAISDDANPNPVPAQFALLPNYPNPFNPETVISYQLPVFSEVDVTVYNLLGEKVVTLVAERQSAGSYQVLWNGRSRNGAALASGVYLARFSAVAEGRSPYQETRKLLLVK